MLRRMCRRRRKGGEEEEGRSRRCGGVGGGDGPAADNGRRTIRDTARGAYDLVGAAAAAFPDEREVAYALDRLEGAVAVGAAR